MNSSSELYVKILSRLRREMHYSNGRNEAFVFAVTYQADINMIIAELEDAKQRVAAGLQDNPNGSMAEGSSPRSYTDGYIAGLVDALHIAQTAQGDP